MPKSACGGRDVASVLGQDTMDMLPREAAHRRRPPSHLGLGIAGDPPERGDHVVSVGWLREVVDGAELDRLDGGGDARVAGQHHDPHPRVEPSQRRDEREPRGVGQA